MVGLDDFELEVDVTSLGSDVTDLVGVMFRYENADNQYLFFINNDGVFALEQQLNGETDFIVGPSRADAINTGNSINRIRIQSDGPALAAYVNDELVAYIIDSTFRRGDINLFASGSSDQEAIFDNLVVTSID